MVKLTPYELNNREKFIRFESARAVAKTAWTAFSEGWSIMTALHDQTNGRTTEHAVSPSGGVRVKHWQHRTMAGKLEVSLYATDLDLALKSFAHEKESNLEMLRSRRYSCPEHLDMWHFLALTSCKYIPDPK
jgi:hypothetical protein